MATLVTGATGLVGARLLPRLVEAGFACRALVRDDKLLPAAVEGAQGISSIQPHFQPQGLSTHQLSH